ncbi:discoidin domain-containing protein [Robertkochia solimangrovi]|uniref:discoidin domain-containing protein n=1 Tax=Robertkochia solimangrovi TaxID=2213046 RepID=UPI0013A5B1C3|nr:discoidin domain-containing protein [Robertkochia solimangrovi]
MKIYSYILCALMFATWTACETDEGMYIDGLPEAVINTDPADAPPRGLTESWFEHTDSLNRQYYESNIAVYYDAEVDRSIEWPFTFSENVWNSALDTYGSIGNDILYAIYHGESVTGLNYLTYFSSVVDGSLIDLPVSGVEMTEEEMTAIISQIGYLIEFSSNGLEGSPASVIWETEFNKIFVFSIYEGLEMEAEAEIVKSSYAGTTLNGVSWFSEWYLPLYETYGGKAMLANFFNILSQNYATDGDSYAKDMDFGEYIHFMSGATGADLQPMAEEVFGWTDADQAQLLQARVTYPNLAYPFDPVSQIRDLSETATITVSKDNDGGPTANEGSLKLIDNDPNSKFLTGNYPNVASDFWLQQELEVAEAVNKYTLISGNDAPARDPRSWRLQGSNDALTWDLLDERIGFTFSARNQTKEFDFDNTVAYKFYRLEIYENGGDYNFQLSEWRLYILETLTAPEPVDYTLNATISVSADNTGGQNAAEGSSSLIDNNTGTKMFLGGYTSDFWMQQDLAEAKIVVKYTLTSGNDAEGRDPKDWELLGSNDGTTWDSLDSRVDQVFESRNQTKEFNVSNTTAYLYYRMNITANNGSADFQLSEWRLIGME